MWPSFLKINVIDDKMVDIWIFFCCCCSGHLQDSMLRVWNEGGPPWTALCEVLTTNSGEISQSQYGETKTDVLGKKKFIFTGVM